jgi:subtilase family serine protease
MKSTGKHLVQNTLTNVTKRRVPEIVPETNRFNKVFVKIEATCYRTPNLCYLDDVSQTGGEVVTLGRY